LKGSPGKTICKTSISMQKSWKGWSLPVTQVMVQSMRKRIIIQATLGKKQKPISKITRVQRAGGVVQVTECLPSNVKP
jgi:hypothetical protein